MTIIVQNTYEDRLKVCEKCGSIFFNRDLIPFCPDCRLKEANYRLDR